MPKKKPAFDNQPLPGMGEPSEVFKRYSRIRQKPGQRMFGGPGGPGGPGRRGGGSFGPRAPLDKSTAARVLRTVFLPYWPRLLVVFAAIVISAQANVRASLFLRTLFDDYIGPLVKMENPAFAGLLNAVGTMALIYLAGIFCTWLYNFLMVGVAQGTLRKIRDQLFEHMQKLPISYFDRHAHGDLHAKAISLV